MNFITVILLQFTFSSGMYLVQHDACKRTRHNVTLVKEQCRLNVRKYSFSSGDQNADSRFSQPWHPCTLPSDSRF